MNQRLAHSATSVIVNLFVALSLGALALRASSQTKPTSGSKQPEVTPCHWSNDENYPIDINKSAGQRGSLVDIKLVVKAGGIDVEDAKIEIRDKGCKLLTSAVTNDWGEYPTKLQTGRYFVSVSWRDSHVERQMFVDTSTHEVTFTLKDK
jgi:hypothetical protein